MAVASPRKLEPALLGEDSPNLTCVPLTKMLGTFPHKIFLLLLRLANLSVRTPNHPIFSELSTAYTLHWRKFFPVEHLDPEPGNVIVGSCPINLSST